MSTLTATAAAAPPPAPPVAPEPPGLAPPGPVLPAWVRGQTINLTRHAAALRPFGRREFGGHAAAPSEGHIQAVNALIRTLRGDLLAYTQRMKQTGQAALTAPAPATLRRLLTIKERGHDHVRNVERIWDFYFELFGQRQSRYADWLLSCDRIALDCYKVAFTGVGRPKSVPAPPPFSYMRTGFSPATYRRGIPLQRLGRQMNPFPLVKLPYHRLVNPWTLGAVLHEVSHNLQNELGLARAVPVSLGTRLLREGLGRAVAATWVGWHREIFSDVSGLLLGGPAFLGSLMDVVGRGTESTLTFVAGKAHPTPYLRPFISMEVLRRIGLPAEAEQYRRAWTALYPSTRGSSIPRAIIDSFADAHRIVVEVIAFQPYAALGGRSLSQVIPFPPNAQPMIEEAAQRLAGGTDPGILPERYLIGAARFALDNRLARPGVIVTNFYQELSRR